MLELDLECDDDRKWKGESGFLFPPLQNAHEVVKSMEHLGNKEKCLDQTMQGLEDYLRASEGY
jgi:hypothetical protein